MAAALFSAFVVVVIGFVVSGAMLVAVGEELFPSILLVSMAHSEAGVGKSSGFRVGGCSVVDIVVVGLSA